MPLPPGSHSLDERSGTIEVRTYRDGVAQQVGHDLVLEARSWRATVEVDEDGEPSAITLDVDPRSLHVRDSVGGVKPLTDRDRSEVRKNIDRQVLRGRPVAFRSKTIEASAESVSVTGELSIAGTSRAVTVELELGDDGWIRGELRLTQSDWGIKPYRALMGALKVRDSVDVAVDAKLAPSEARS